METFRIYWSNYDTSKRNEIGLLVHHEAWWYFKYNEQEIMEAINHGFRPFPDMPDTKKIYESKELFQVFKSRYHVTDPIDTIHMMKNSCGDLITDKILIDHVENNKKRIR